MGSVSLLMHPFQPKFEWCTEYVIHRGTENPNDPYPSIDGNIGIIKRYCHETELLHEIVLMTDSDYFRFQHDS